MHLVLALGFCIVIFAAVSLISHLTQGPSVHAQPASAPRALGHSPEKSTLLMRLRRRESRTWEPSE